MTAQVAVPLRRVVLWALLGAGLAVAAGGWLAERDAASRRAVAAAEAGEKQQAAARAEAAKRSPDYVARAELLDKAREAGLVARLDVDRDVPRMWVTRAFMGQPRQRREQLVTALYHQCTAVKERCVVLVQDDASSAEIAEFSWVTGLVWR